MSIAKYVYCPLAVILYVNVWLICWVLTYMSRWIIVSYKPCLFVNLNYIWICISVIELIFFKIDGQILIRRSYFKYLTSNQHKCDITDCIISTCIVPKCPLFPGMTVYNQFAGNIFTGRRSKFCNIRNVWTITLLNKKGKVIKLIHV